MRTVSAVFALLTALPLGAQATQTLQVNAQPLGALENDQQLMLSRSVTAQKGETVLLKTELTFSLPSEDPKVENFKDDRFAVAVGTDGTVMVYDGDDLVPLALTVEEGETVSLTFTAYQGKDEETTHDAAIYEARFEKDDTTVEVYKLAITPDAGYESILTEALTFAEVRLEGEGTATGLSVAHVSTDILPSNPETGAQDPEKVSAYVTWLNDSEKGGAMVDASDAEQSDAFAMNVGGTPSLDITAIEPQDDGAVRITVKGSYKTRDSTVADAPLNAIHGTLYATYAETLGGAAKTEAFAVEVAADGTATFTVPFEKNARFLRARVALAKPEDTL